MRESRERRRAINVLWINHTSLVSGAEESMRAVMGRWRRERDNEFFDIDAVASLPGDGPLAQALREEGTGVVFAPMRRLSRPRGLFDSASLLTHVWQTVPLVARLIRQTNSHLLHSNSSTSHLIGGLAAARVNVPAIWHARDLTRLGKAAPFFSTRAARVIAISNCVAESLQKQGVPQAKIQVIHNGLDPEAWKLQADAPRLVRRQLRWDKEFVFGAISQMVPWKNHAAFLRAAALLCDEERCSHARFVLVGGDLWNEHAPYIAGLRALVSELGIASRVRFLDFQKDNLDLVASLDCLVHPALEEPLGRVLMEALAMSRPTVAFARNGPLEVIEHEHDGLLAQEPTPEALAEQMRRVLLDAELRAHIEHNGPQTIREKFHIADTARATADLYREVLA